LIARRSFLHQLNPLHSIVARKAFVAVFPFDRDVGPINSGDPAEIGGVTVETHAIADLQLFRLFGRHLLGCPKTPRREFDLSVWQLPPLIDDSRVTALCGLVDEFTNLGASYFDRQREC
jgi:hypothetical protein